MKFHFCRCLDVCVCVRHSNRYTNYDWCFLSTQKKTRIPCYTAVNFCCLGWVQPGLCTAESVLQLNFAFAWASHLLLQLSRRPLSPCVLWLWRLPPGELTFPSTLFSISLKLLTPLSESSCSTLSLSRAVTSTYCMPTVNRFKRNQGNIFLP